MIFFLRLIGTVLARLPEPATRMLAALAGDMFFLIARQRRRIVLANLTHAFPERSHRWIMATGRESIRQMVEFGLLTAALPALSEKSLQRIFFKSPASDKVMGEQTATGRPAIVLAPHLGPQEALCLLPFLFPDMPPIGGIYRPIDNHKMDTWIRTSRERFGVQLFSRKRGLQNAIRMLKDKEWLGLLFDQNSTKQGALITFFDRVASATELPGILAARHEADILFLYAARRGFWRIELCVETGPATQGKDQINFAINLWLEKLLKNHEELLPSWLWAHNRWRHQRRQRFVLRGKRNLLEEQNIFLGRAHLPRKEPFFIRLPDRLGEVVPLLPLLRAFRQSRPDAEITILGASTFLPLIQNLGLCEKIIPLPPAGPAYFLFFWRLRWLFPTLQIVFPNSFRADLEAWLIGAPHRFGLRSAGKRRRFLNHLWSPPGASDATEPVQIWEAFMRAQEMEGALDPSPFTYGPPTKQPEASHSIGLFCGAGQAPKDLWPVEQWRALIEEILERDAGTSIKLLGAGSDSLIASAVAEGFAPERLSNLTGTTTTSELAEHLITCKLVAGIPSGGIDLAHALGVPTVVLAKPGAPSGSLFAARQIHLEPSASTGTINDIPVARVLASVLPDKVQA